MFDLSNAIWTERYYYETVFFTIGFLIFAGAFLYFQKSRKAKYKALWVSIKSWLFIAPLFLFVAGAPYPWSLILLTLICIYSSKTFFKMVGIYHRNYFVLLTYLFTAFISYAIYNGKAQQFGLISNIFLISLSLIPILRNNYKHMVQYFALTIMAFIFFGWSLMHFGLILQREKGM